MRFFKFGIFLDMGFGCGGKKLKYVGGIMGKGLRVF